MTSIDENKVVILISIHIAHTSMMTAVFNKTINSLT